MEMAGVDMERWILNESRKNLPTSDYRIVRMAFASRDLRNDLETAGGERRDGRDGNIANVRPEGAFLDGFEEGVHFVGLAAALHFDAAVVEIAHPSDDVETAGDLLDGVSESDALNAPFVENLATLHKSLNESRPSPNLHHHLTGWDGDPLRVEPDGLCATLRRSSGYRMPMKSLVLAVLGLSLTLQAYEVPEPLGKANARAFPYSMVGQLLFDNGNQGYLGSGTVIRPRSVLTAAHNLFDPKTGWSTDVEFRRSNYGDNDYLSRTFARRLYVLGGYRSNASYYGAESLLAFAKDLGGIVFREQPGAGGYAGWAADPSLLFGTAYNILLGYGAESHDGETLLYVEPETAFFRTYGPFLENDSILIEGGMSGGPVFAEMDDGDLYVTGVVVAASSRPPTSGIRMINAKGATFIRTYLP